MAGLWEGLPASPCSAVSDDAPVRSTRQSVAAFKHSAPFPPLQIRASTSPLRKRMRESSDVDMDASCGSIEFVEANADKCDRSADLVARLNTSAADERRKTLMMRLKAIEQTKAKLAAKLTGTQDEVTIVEDKSTPKPVSAALPPPSPTPSGGSRTARTRRKPRSAPASKRQTRTRKTPTPVDIIDVDNDSKSSCAHVPMDVDSGAGKKPSAPMNSATSSGALVKRTSSRVRRPRVPNLLDETSMGKSVQAPMPTCMSKCKRVQFCKRLIATLLRNPTAAPFKAPVNELWSPEAIPRYFEIISKPMDLRTVKKNLDMSVYIHPRKDYVLPYELDAEKFADDVRLVFRNCLLYNRKGDMLFNCALGLLDDFNKTWDEQLPPIPTPAEVSRTVSKRKRTGGRGARKEQNTAMDKVQRSNVELAHNGGDVMIVSSQMAPATARRKIVREASPAPQDDQAELSLLSVKELREKLSYLRRCRPAVQSRAPVPEGSGYLSRAALLYDVEMSFSQKQRCSSGMSRVPTDKLEALFNLIKSGTSKIESNDGESDVEVDVDSLDNRTMRNIEAFLEQYIPGFKTIRTSTLGREFASVSEVDTEIEAVQLALTQVSKEEKSKRRVGTKTQSFFSEGMTGIACSSSDSSSSEDSDESDSSGSESE